ncbi:hypothetical protein GH714_009563 [Hevea brasiliensis]|uniref:Fatty acid hydroxylase domain-containing protein n=1 Tax=Hevea brasiliensis TaxID=3981 RepID=A0A6A6MLV9_HEVBR|nr:hypothetical protein GH714_009563 [Hevea brasiliensis]
MLQRCYAHVFSGCGSLAIALLSFYQDDWYSDKFATALRMGNFSTVAGYFVVEDYTNYWIHRFLHGKWGYEKIHRVHHEYAAPIGFAAPYAHWAEILILGIPSFLGPAMVPGHMITFWSWIALRQIEAIETHSGSLLLSITAMLESFLVPVIRMISLGLPQNIFHFTVAQITMITIIMLENRAKATLLQSSPTVTLFMELTRAIGIKRSYLGREERY